MSPKSQALFAKADVNSVATDEPACAMQAFGNGAFPFPDDGMPIVASGPKGLESCRRVLALTVHIHS